MAFPVLCRVQSGCSLEGRGFLTPTDILRLTLSPLGSQGQVGSRVSALWSPFWPIICVVGISSGHKHPWCFLNSPGLESGFAVPESARTMGFPPGMVYDGRA